MSKNGNKPAYPLPRPIDETLPNIGLTKREMFAMAAMQGLLSGDYKDKNIHNNIELPEIKLICEQSVAYADELLKQLES